MYIFANQPGPIPLYELDYNFSLIPNYANTAGTITTNAQPNITSVGNLTSLTVTGNVTGSNITMSVVNGTSLVGTITTPYQPNILQVGSLTSLTVTGNINSANITNSGKITSAAYIGTINTNAQPYITSVGDLTALSVVGDVVAGSNVTVDGDLVVHGNATIQGTVTSVDSQTVNIADKNITIANNVSTSILINGAGIDAGNPVVSYLRYSDSNKGWGTANNFSVGGNITIDGTGAVTGILTAPTAANATSNTQVATTAFVHNLVGTLGTMASQDSSAVAITGGSINSLSVTSLGTNSYGTKTVSSSTPTGGSDGDIWYQI